VCLALLAFVVTAHAVRPCAKPRVRREWRSISEAEREAWVAAVKCLKTVPHKPTLNPTLDLAVTQIPPVNPNSSYFDDFVYVHMDLNPLIHFTGFFLPWHRAYVNDFEAALRTECGYKGAHPYWDWTLDASPNFPNATIFNDSPTSGFGGWGNPADDYQITTGAFADNFEVVYPIPHKIRRNYTARNDNPDPFGDGTPAAPDALWNYFTPTSQKALVEGFVGDFQGFQALLEGQFGPHIAIHHLLGGDMTGSCPQGLIPPNCYRGAKWSSNDPLFMMHHAMVDKIWYEWQNARPENFWSFIGGSVGAHSQAGLYQQFPTGGPPFLNFGDSMPTDGILKNATIFQLMDTENERMCYVYE